MMRPSFLRALPSVVGSALVTVGLLISCGGSDQPQPPTEQPTADSGPVDAADDSAVGTLGAPCDKPGTLACAGHAQKLQLLCDGTWKSNGVCLSRQPDLRFTTGADAGLLPESGSSMRGKEAG